MVEKAKHHNVNIESVSESACHLECNNHIGDDNDILMKIKCNQCCAKSCLRTRMAVSACVCRSCIEYTTTCPTDEPTSSPVVSAPSDDSGGDTNRSNGECRSRRHMMTMTAPTAIYAMSFRYTHMQNA